MFLAVLETIFTLVAFEGAFNLRFRAYVMLGPLGGNFSTGTSMFLICLLDGLRDVNAEEFLFIFFLATLRAFRCQVFMFYGLSRGYNPSIFAAASADC